jgi:hypothetical protein
METSQLTERRIADAPAARTLWRKLRSDSEPRREKWSQVQNQIDGAPPMSTAALVESGQGWRCNVNFRDASSTLEQVLVSYWRLLHDTTNLAAVSVLTQGDPNSERWEQIFQTNFNRFNDDWGADYVRNYLLFSLNHVSFGVGIAFWNDKFSPRWEAVRLGEIEVPARAKASVEKLPVAGIRQEMEFESLWELVRTPEKRTASAAIGWNVPELQKLLANELLKREGDKSAVLGEADLLELQRTMHNNSLGATAGHNPVSLVHLLVKEHDGKISRCVFAESDDDNNAFMFDDSKVERPTSMNHVLGAVFFDAGNGDWWGAKGFGVKNYQLAQVTNRLKSRAVDRTLLDGLNFRDLSEGGRETVPIVSMGPFNFLPRDIEQVQSYPTGRSILETIEMLESQSAYNNARYRDQGRQIAQTDTATQANILANMQSQVDVANATLYLRQIARNLFNEQFRRLRLRGSPDDDAKHFKQRCLDMGMPEKVFFEAEIAIRTGSDPGAANLLLQGEKALQGMQMLQEGNKRWFAEKWVAANFGAQAVSKALHPVDATSDIKSVRFATIENSEMGQGMPMPVDPQDNHAAHVPQHVQPLEVIVHNYDATGRIDPNALIALQFGVPHLEAHFEYLKQDKLQEAVFKEFWPRFTAIRSGAMGIFRTVERMHNEVSQQPQPGFDPAGEVGAAVPQ